MRYRGVFAGSSLKSIASENICLTAESGLYFTGLNQRKRDTDQLIVVYREKKQCVSIFHRC
jgi:hypothetical protein